jgi:hypothetical protein
VGLSAAPLPMALRTQSNRRDCLTGLLFDGPSRAARQLTAIYPLLRIFGLCYGDSGIFVRWDVYHQIGGFRSLPLFEDLDVLRRLRRVGRFVHLDCRIVTSSRRFEQRNFALVWLHWTMLQLLYWCGVSPSWLSRWYPHARRASARSPFRVAMLAMENTHSAVLPAQNLRNRPRKLSHFVHEETQLIIVR